MLALLKGLANDDLRLYVQPVTPMPWPKAPTTQPAVPVTVADASVLPYTLPEVQLRATLREPTLLVVVSLPDATTLPPLTHVQVFTTQGVHVVITATTPLNLELTLLLRSMQQP